MARNGSFDERTKAGRAYFENAPMDFRFTPGFRRARLRATPGEERFIQYIVNGILGRKYRGMITCRLDHKLNGAVIQEWPTCSEIEKLMFSALDLAPWRPALLLVAKIGTHQAVLGIAGEDDSDLSDGTGQVIGPCSTVPDE
jgi:hypothetical protein